MGFFLGRSEISEVFLLFALARILNHTPKNCKREIFFSIAFAICSPRAHMSLRPPTHARSVFSRCGPYTLRHDKRIHAEFPLLRYSVFSSAHAHSCVASQNTHRGARTHDHKVKGLALCRLS